MVDLNVVHDQIHMVYSVFEGLDDLQDYHDKHGTPSLLILTQYSPKIARESAHLMADEIRGKKVIEIGAGVGFLAIEMAKIATSVIAIEVDPAWSWVFTRSLYRHKPENLTWVFGKAQEIAKLGIRGEVAVVFTRSGIEDMRQVAAGMADKVIMPLQEEPSRPDDR